MDIGRIVISLVIWVGCLGVAITTLLTNSNMIGVIFPLIMAVGGTATLWGNEASSKRAAAREFHRQDFGKAKNESAYEQKMRLLMDMMDDDEREDFKRSLKRQLLNQDSERGRLVDGEMPFDMDLFEPDERHHR